MAFSANLPGSLEFSKVEFYDFPSLTSSSQKSCYSYFQKVAALTTPLGLQHDTLYPNAYGTVVGPFMEHAQEESGSSPFGAFGCKGHQIDNEFPLESRTPFPLPLVMYPSETNGKLPDEFDMCARPVLNWEAYIHSVKQSLQEGVQSACPGRSKGKGRQKALDRIMDYGERGDADEIDDDGPTAEEIINEAIQSSSQATSVRTHVQHQNAMKRVGIKAMKVILNETEGVQGKPGARKNRNRDGREKKLELEDVEYHQMVRSKRGKISAQCLTRFKEQPQLRVEGTWNHNFGGSNGACCFMKVWSMHTASKQPCLFVSKGSQLRAINLQEALPSSILSLKVESVWEETVPSGVTELTDIIFQLLPNEQNDILGVRRGTRVDLFSVEEGSPYLLESIPSTSYGTNTNYLPRRTTKVECSTNPLLLGCDFNPDYGPELITIDENWVVRICDFTQSTTESFCPLPSNQQTRSVPPGYPVFKLNEAAGVSFTHHGKLFYSWADSVIYLGDRRDHTLSRSKMTTLFDLRKGLHSLALSDQNLFHDNQAVLNEYVSCVRRSQNDQYFYVGTTSKIYLMDQRVPSRPVIKISHGLQSPLSYLDTCSDGNFETVVGASQRLPETVCMITDTAHIQCIGRSGCTTKHPVLQSYPQHLSHPRAYFDGAGKEGFEFPMPVDHNNVKNHHYAWTTGLAIWRSTSRSDPKQPGGLVVATSNYFGDLFLQEWLQKPVESHQKVNIRDVTIQNFMKQWQRSMSRSISVTHKPDTSKNKWNPVDCSVLVQPITSEIENLTKIRETPFHCFKSADEPSQTLSRTVPIEDIMYKLKRYKGDRVTSILDVWNDLETENRQVEEVVIKEEPIDLMSPSHASYNTIELDSEPSECMQTEAEEQFELPVIDFNPPRTIDVPSMESNDGSCNAFIESLVSSSVNETDTRCDPGGSTSMGDDEFLREILDGSLQQSYSQPQEDMQPYDMLSYSQEDLYGSLPSSQRPSRSRTSTKKSKSSGFL